MSSGRCPACPAPPVSSGVPSGNRWPVLPLVSGRSIQGPPFQSCGERQILRSSAHHGFCRPSCSVPYSSFTFSVVLRASRYSSRSSCRTHSVRREGRQAGRSPLSISRRVVLSDTPSSPAASDTVRRSSSLSRLPPTSSGRRLFLAPGPRPRDLRALRVEVEHHHALPHLDRVAPRGFRVYAEVLRERPTCKGY